MTGLTEARLLVCIVAVAVEVRPVVGSAATSCGDVLSGKLDGPSGGDFHSECPEVRNREAHPQWLEGCCEHLLNLAGRAAAVGFRQSVQHDTGVASSLLLCARLRWRQPGRFCQLVGVLAGQRRSDSSS